MKNKILIYSLTIEMVLYPITNVLKPWQEKDFKASKFLILIQFTKNFNYKKGI